MTIAIIIVFCLGFLAIAMEHSIRVNKAATALLTGVLCWTLLVLDQGVHSNLTGELTEHMGDISSILFFLLGAMTIVELIDAHDGFEIIQGWIRTRDLRTLMWIVSGLSFVLSAVLDNLTTTIVMVSLVRKLIPTERVKLFFAGLIVIAANAGGAWSPIGDVTTTMLWVGGQISTIGIIGNVLIPSILNILIPLIGMSFVVKGNLDPAKGAEARVEKEATASGDGLLVLIIGVLSLLMVPVFKQFTHLPPFMGMLLGLGLMWVITEFIHHEKDEIDKDRLSVNFALRKIDTPSILFFLGILLSVSALETGHLLEKLAISLQETLPGENALVFSIGILSAIVDNVPIVAAVQGMYGLDQYTIDHHFWHFISYAAGTGGSLLIIGSAAGVAAMGMARIEFGWYLRKISPWAFLGYMAGALYFLFS
jgi:Na+/H+ antiporter NhaD/arsenite permease-like protein